MTRISSLAANTSLLQQIFRTRRNLFDLEIQVASQKVSQDYRGIASQSERLINQENTANQLKQFISNNQLMDLRLDIATTTMGGLRDVVREFRIAMLDYQTSDVKDEVAVKDIQDNAFRSLQSIQSLLNTEVDGRFLFSGARVGTQPVDLGLTSISDFQSTFDGSRVQVSTTRDSQLEDFSFNKDSGTTAANWLTFERNVGAVAQVDTISVAGVVEADDIFTVTLNGVSFSASGADANTVATTLAAPINGSGEPVTASAPAGGIFTLTANVAGAAFTSAVATTEADLSAADAQTIATAPTTLNVLGGSRVTATSSEFTNVTVGSTITITGTGGVNDGTFEVIAKTGTTLTIRTEQLTDEAANPVTITYQDPADSTKTIILNTTIAFTRANNTMVRSAGDAITDVPVGAKITITNGSANNASFTVKSNDGTNLVVESKRFTDQGTGAAPLLSFTSAVNEITFTDNTPSKDTIVAAVGRFTNLKAGMKVTISGATDGGNNITFTVSSVSTDGSTITVDEDVTARVNDNNTVTFLTQAAGGTISSTSYFNGDQVSLTHRVDTKRSFEYDLTAIDPGFEKAIRAMKIALQGEFKTEGGLDQNTDRIDKIVFLLNSALDRAPGGTPPFGAELTSNIEQIELDLGFDRFLIDTTNKLHADLISFLDGRISNTEDINLTEAITTLLDQQLALEASFQVFARIRQLSLSNFL